MPAIRLLRSTQQRRHDLWSPAAGFMCLPRPWQGRNDVSGVAPYYRVAGERASRVARLLSDLSQR
jgi:hypothetical protein